MFRNRWATGDKYKYYFDKSGVAIAGRWLNYGGKRYYFLKNSRMATGWNTIGKYQYYFNKTSGAMAVNQWIGHYYVDGNGRKTSQTRPGVKYNASHYSYRSNTLHIDLSRKSVHGVPYWVATVNISNAGRFGHHFLLALTEAQGRPHPVQFPAMEELSASMEARSAMRLAALLLLECA